MLQFPHFVSINSKVKFRVRVRARVSEHSRCSIHFSIESSAYRRTIVALRQFGGGDIKLE